MKQFVILISSITALKETSGSQMPCPVLGKITHTHTLLFDSFHLISLGYCVLDLW